MALWNNQSPGETVLSFRQSLFDNLYLFEIDKVPRPDNAPHRGYLDHAHPVYRLTMGTLFESHEIMQSGNLLGVIQRLQTILQAPNKRAAYKAINGVEQEATV